MPNTAKRKSFTSDDLMRRLEGDETRRKRLKQVEEEEPVSEEESDFVEDEDIKLLEARLKKQNNGLEDDLNDSEHSDSNFDEESDGDKVQLSSRGQPACTHRIYSFEVYLSFLPVSITSETSRLKIATQRPKSIQADTVKKEYQDFASFGIYKSLVSSMNTMSIRKPTPVQAACIPPLLAGQAIMCHF